MVRKSLSVLATRVESKSIVWGLAPARISRFGAEARCRPPCFLLRQAGEFSGKVIDLKWERESMKKARFTEEQIAFPLRQAETGTPVAEVIRKMRISEQTFYRWKKQYAGMGVADLRRLNQLEEENRKLKQLVADLSLDKAMLQNVIRSKL